MVEHHTGKLPWQLREWIHPCRRYGWRCSVIHGGRIVGAFVGPTEHAVVGIRGFITGSDCLWISVASAKQGRKGRNLYRVCHKVFTAGLVLPPLLFRVAYLEVGREGPGESVVIGLKLDAKGAISYLNVYRSIVATREAGKHTLLKQRRPWASILRRRSFDTFLKISKQVG